jgi:beta-lactam-binding protein with PASTA domain
MSLKNFITSRVFLKHLILAILLILVIVIITLQRLKSYTHHGESYPVPNLIGLTVDEIEAVADQYNIKYEIIDSIHADDAKPGAIVEQVPEAGFKVKKNRIVFLTINSTVPEKVILPKLTDISFRQAQGLIENCGLVIDSIIYEPSEYNNLVLKVIQNSSVLNQGDIILKGSGVELVIGSSNGIQETPLPDLTGLTYSEAGTLLTNYMLNIGVLICDETIVTQEDSLSAFIWKQYPGNNIRFVSLGTSVDLWLTLDSLKIPKPTLKETE